MSGTRTGGARRALCYSSYYYWQLVALEPETEAGEHPGVQLRKLSQERGLGLPRLKRWEVVETARGAGGAGRAGAQERPEGHGGVSNRLGRWFFHREELNLLKCWRQEAQQSTVRTNIPGRVGFMMLSCHCHCCEGAGRGVMVFVTAAWCANELFMRL